MSTSEGLSRTSASPATSAPSTRMLGEDLIGVINQVHDALSTLDIRSQIDLPQIAVLGSQSAGKSSVLESIVGRDFLPRGSGIVTRCPLVLKLSLQKPGSQEWGEFSHNPGQKYFDFSEIRTEIEKRTEKIAGTGSISPSPISLTIFSPRVLNLTLIDLPGLVSNAVGNQDPGIVKQIHDMVVRFVSPPNTLILAVSPANADLATSVSLKIAKEVDPDFDRTIGVLTKLDLMDEGTHAADVLENRVIALKRGWVGVVNRSQKAINTNKSMEAARAAEKEYFAKHPSYRHLANRSGTEYLAQVMSTLLLSHIQRCLPDLHSRIDDLVTQTRKKQEELGMLEPEMDPASTLLAQFNQFNKTMHEAVEGGTAGTYIGKATKNELYGGARLDFIFHEAFASYVFAMRAGPQLTTEKLRTVIRNSSGIQANLFPSDRAFLTITKEQVMRLEEPSVQCVLFVHEELRKLCSHISATLDRFPVLKERVLQLCFKMLDELRVPCVAHVKTMMLSESQYVNVRNPRMQDLIVARGRMRGGGAVTDGTNTNGKDKGKDGKPGANNSGGDGELGRTQTRQLAVESAARALNGNRFDG